MKRPRRTQRVLLLLFAAVVGLLALAVAAVFFAIQTDWFKNKVRERIIASVEDATGGRAEIGAFKYDWHDLTASIAPFVLHGREPASSAPLFRATKLEVQVKIISFSQRSFDISYLSIERPEINLIIAPDGSSNLPVPKLPLKGSAIQKLLDLKIAKLDLSEGLISYNEQRARFDLEGKALRANFQYDGIGRRYIGQLSARPLRFNSAVLREPLVFDLSADGALRQDRIEITSAQFTMGQTSVSAKGAITNLNKPCGTFDVTARFSPADMLKSVQLPISDRGQVMFHGKVTANTTPFNYEISGKLRASGIEYGGELVHLNNVSLASFIKLVPDQIDLPNAEIKTLGGTFKGGLKVAHGKLFSTNGTAINFPIQELATATGRKANGLNGTVTGPVQVEGVVTSKGIEDLSLAAKVDLVPGSTGVPLEGSVDVHYKQSTGQITIDNSNLRLGSTEVSATGILDQSLKVHLMSRNLDDVAAALPLMGQRAPAELPIALKNGVAEFDGYIEGPAENLRITGQARAEHLQVKDQPIDRLLSNFDCTKSDLRMQKLVADQGPLHVEGTGEIGLTNWRVESGSPVSATITGHGVDLGKLLSQTPIRAPVSGTASGSVILKGTVAAPEANAQVQVGSLILYDENLGPSSAHLTYSGRTLKVLESQFKPAGGTIHANGSYNWSEKDWQTGELRFDLAAKGLTVAQAKHIQDLYKGLNGQLDMSATGHANIAPGKVDFTTLEGRFDLKNAVLNKHPYGTLTVTASMNGPLLDLKAVAEVRGTHLEGAGQWRLAGDYSGHAHLDVPKLSFPTLHDLVPGPKAGDQLPFDGFIQGEVDVAGPLDKPNELKADIALNAVQINANPAIQPVPGVQAKDLVLRNSNPILIEATTKGLEIKAASFTGTNTTIEASGRLSFDSQSPWDLRLNGNVNLAVLQIFNPDLLGTGDSIIRATVRGPLKDPQVDGRLELRNASLFLKDVPNGVDAANGVIVFDRNRATVRELSATTGGGKVNFLPGSFVGFRGLALTYRLQAEANNVRYRSNEGISVTVSAALSLIGTSENSLLSGTLTVQRAAVNPKTDVGALLAATAKPISAPTTPNEYLRGIQFDLRVVSSQSLEIETSLTRNVQAEADLRVRGTLDKPVVLGNIAVNSGQIDFFGNKYTITHGEIDFLNTAKIEPILNMDLETKVRGITVDIVFAGPLNKLNFSYRSDPPFETNQIIALLAVGRDPAATGGLASAQNLTNESFLATGTNALLSQAITPDNGALQRFFGVSHIKIDPQFTDITTIPQARLTLEQQISREVTLTYITNLTRTQEQIVRVELDLSRQWSVVALRDENGAFGIDFQYRKRFK